MRGKSFIDTNIVIYSLGNDSPKAAISAPLFLHSPTISTQVLSETANVVTKRLGFSNAETHRLLSMLEQHCRIELITTETIRNALNLREQCLLSWYDALIVATALQAGCTTLYSEDMQHRQQIDGLQIINPFAAEPAP